MKYTIRFGEPYELPRVGHATEMSFPYTIVRSDLINAPEERINTKYCRLKVGISWLLAASWRLQPDDLIKVLFEYGKRDIVKRVKDNTLTPEQEMWLSTEDYPPICPFDPDRILAPSGATIVVDTSTEALASSIASSQLAAAIIEVRDNINTVYHRKYGEKLIVLGEERDLLQFFQDCESAEALAYRISSLRNAAANLNVDSLRKVTGITDSHVQSIGLLEAYLQNIRGFQPAIVKPLKELNRLRQGYPVHGDRTTGVLGALAYFSIAYPVTDYSVAWKVLLQRYGETLRQILALVKEDVFPSQDIA